MSSLQYGNEPGAGTIKSEKNGYMQYVHLPHGITKLSGQGGWLNDDSIDGNDWKGQIDNAWDNIERVLKAAGLLGLEDVRKSQPQAASKHLADCITGLSCAELPHRHGQPLQVSSRDAEEAHSS